jgi:PAS domain S-box-containing protein
VTDYAIYLLDRECVVRTWNAGAERIMGYPAREAIGQHFSLFFISEDKAADAPSQILARASLAGRAEEEGWLLRKDSGRFWAASVIQPVRDVRGRAVGFANISRDMTERRAAQQALYESERKFRLLVQAVKDCAIYMLDPSGIVVNWNSGAERLKGYSAAEIIGSIFRNSTREKIGWRACHLGFLSRPRARAIMRPKAGESAKMADASGRPSRSTRSATRTVN